MNKKKVIIEAITTLSILITTIHIQAMKNSDAQTRSEESDTKKRTKRTITLADRADKSKKNLTGKVVKADQLVARVVAGVTTKTNQLNEKINQFNDKINQCNDNEEMCRDVKLATGIKSAMYILDHVINNKTTKKLHRAAHYNLTTSLSLFILPSYNLQAPPSPWHNALINNITKMGLALGTDYIFEREPIKKIITQHISPSKQELAKNVAAITVIGTTMLLFEKMKNI